MQQDNAHSRMQQDSDQSRMQQYSNQSRIKVTNPQISDLYEKMHNLESLMTKTHSLLEKVLKQQQHEVPLKPAFLPISTLAGMTEFQNIDDNGYKETVNYLEYVGGYNLKEAVNLCFKEVLNDCLLKSYSWLGRKENNLALSETRVVRAIHDAVLQSRHFPKPSRKKVAECLKTALRTAKERVRSRKRSLPNPQRTKADNFYGLPRKTLIETRRARGSPAAKRSRRGAEEKSKRSRREVEEESKKI